VQPGYVAKPPDLRASKTRPDRIALKGIAATACFCNGQRVFAAYVNIVFAAARLKT